MAVVVPSPATSFVFVAEYPGLPVVCAGGVMSSDIIRTWVQQRLPQVYFVPGQYSSDNAIGVSILAAREAGLWLM